jgi:hypothetical protein
MKARSVPQLLAVAVSLLGADCLRGQQEKVAALKQSLSENQKRLRQYHWIETTVVSLKGEEKSRTQKLCFYGPDGKVQKQPLTAPVQQQSPGGLKGKVVAKKKEEMTEYMQQAAGLVHQYVPPDPQRIQTVKAAGGLTITPTGPGAAKLEFHNYLKKGDSLSLNLATADNSIQTINVNSYLESEKDAITMSVTFARLGDGLSYPANIVLDAPAKKVQVKIQNSNYENVAAQGQAPASQTKAAPASKQTAQAIDQLTGPIALYPDALIAQILTAATNVAALQSFAAWMQKNANLKGSDLQDAAQKAGFDAAYVALAPFPQVIQMMAQKPDWTKQLGQAFTTDKNAVFDSIQRLRAQAQAAGNLKTTPQQQVVTQTTSTGQQVIVIQPANPQVIYVPQYNPQVVYVAAPPPPPGPSVAATAAVAFTAGVIIGASSSHYYHGPYAWHGAAMYNEAWDHRNEYVDHRNEHYQENASQRQSAAHENQAQRQSAAQANQAQRQSAISSSQSQATANQAQRQSSASSMQTQAAANQSQRQSAAATSSYGSGQTASQRSGTRSGGFSGYQSGAATRAQSARGSGSLSSSRSGSGRKR